MHGDVTVPSYKPPGEYREEIANAPMSMVNRGDAIPAFIGYTQTTLENGAMGTCAMNASSVDFLHACKRIASMGEFEQYFGLPQPEANLRLSIVETVDALDHVLSSQVSAVLAGKDRSPYILHYAMQLFFANGGDICYIIPIGQYQSVKADLALEDFMQGLQAAATLDEVTLLVLPEAQALSLQEYRELANAALAQCAFTQQRMLLLDVPLTENTALDVDVQSFRQQCVGSKNLQYGAAYTPNLITAIAYAVDEADLQVTYETNGKASTLSLLQLCTQSPRLYAAVRKQIGELRCELPPSAAIAAIYQVRERERGAWTAPANVSLNAVCAPSLLIQEFEQDALNVDAVTGKSINAIRQFPGKGVLIWGARTLAGNDNEFRYVPVLRLVMGIHDSIGYNIYPFLLEPNNQATWLRIQAMIENFLHRLWQAGAMKGTKPEQAYYVKVGLGFTMTASDILEGALIIETGVAPIKPGEFIIIKNRARFVES